MDKPIVIRNPALVSIEELAKLLNVKPAELRDLAATLAEAAASRDPRVRLLGRLASQRRLRAIANALPRAS